MLHCSFQEDRSERVVDGSDVYDGPVDEKLEELLAGHEMERRMLALSLVDQEKFGWFFDEYHDVIHDYFSNTFGDDDLADDLCQITFLKALRSRHRFVFRRSSFVAWLFAIARNEIRMEFRRRKSKKVFQIDEDTWPGDTIDRNTPNPEQEYIERENERRLRAALDKMDPDTSSILVLRFVQGLSTQRLAKLMDLPMATMKSRLYRGFSELRRLIGGDDG